MIAATIDQLKTQLSALPDADRAELANFLLDSLEPADEGVEEAWREEIGGRLEEIKNGTAVWFDGEEVMSELRRRYS